MVYIQNWDEFAEASRQLFVASPIRTRYSIKYRHQDACLVLKVTDDKTCLKYKTDQQSDVKVIEKLNTLFVELMSNPKAKEEHTPAQKEHKEPPAQKEKEPAKSKTPQGTSSEQKAAKRKHK